MWMMMMMMILPKGRFLSGISKICVIIMRKRINNTFSSSRFIFDYGFLSVSRQTRTHLWSTSAKPLSPQNSLFTSTRTISLPPRLFFATALRSFVCSSTCSPTLSSVPSFHRICPPAHMRLVKGAGALNVRSVPSAPRSSSSSDGVKYTRWYPGGTGVPAGGQPSVRSSWGPRPYLRPSVRHNFCSWLPSRVCFRTMVLSWKVCSI